MTSLQFDSDTRLSPWIATIVSGIVFAAIGIAAVHDVLLQAILLLVLSGFFIAMIVRPKNAIAVVFFAILTNSASVLSDWHGFPLLTEAMTILLITIIIKDLAMGRHVGTNVGRFAFLLAAFLIYLFVSALWAKHSPQAVLGALSIAKVGFVALLLVCSITTQERLVAATTGIVAGAVFLSVITVTQFLFGLYSMNFGGYGVATFHHIAGEIDSWRVDGPLTDPNYYALVLVVALPFTVEWTFRDRSPLRLLAGITMSALVMSATLLTYSRGALLAVILLSVVFMWKQISRNALVAMAFTLAGIVALPSQNLPYFNRVAAAVNDVSYKLSGEGYLQDDAIKGRLAEMHAAYLLFLENPVFGTGYDQYELLYQDTARRHGLMARGADRQAHSLILETLAERGMAGLALFLTLLFATVASVLSGRRASALLGSATVPRIGKALLFSIGAFLAGSIFLHDAFPIYFWMLVALGFSVSQIQPEPDLNYDYDVEYEDNQAPSLAGKSGISDLAGNAQASI